MDHPKDSDSIPEDEEIEILCKRDEQKRTKKKKKVPYEIVRDEAVGRHMVAARDVEAGEVIFVESPLTFGPSDNSKVVCIGCYKRIREPLSFCSKCGYPTCGPECEEAPEHRDAECALFQRAGHRVDGSKFDFRGEEKSYNVISPLRALLLRRREEEKRSDSAWSVLWRHMSHSQARKKSKFWSERTAETVEALKACTGSEFAEFEELAEAVLGVLLVNDFEIGARADKEEGGGGGEDEDDGQSIRGLFGLASIPSHSCVANATHEFADRMGGYRMTMRATVRIPRGSDITHSYTEPLDPILTRRSLMRVGKFFDCKCPRCCDPSELGTFSSSVWCRGCGRGHLTTTDAQDIEARWACSRCGAETACEKVQQVHRAAKLAAEKLDPSRSSPQGATVEQYEAFIKSYAGRVLHPNHVVLVDRKYYLAKMYGRAKGYEADSMSDVHFERKMSLCREVLSVLDKIMPGRTRKRGMMLYELHLPLVMLANRSLQRGPGAPGVEPDKIKSQLKESLLCLKEGLSILGDEPEGSFERKIVDGSKDSVKQLEDWVKTICSALK